MDTAPTIPAGSGWVVEVRTGANPFVNITAASTTINVPASSDLNIDVRITVPSGIPVLTGYSTVLRATSGITAANWNETIDRVWTGFINAVKTQSVLNSTGVGPANAAVPGAVITYTITYTNVTAASGTNNANLTATNVIVTEDGSAAPNNWASFTNHVVGSVVVAPATGVTITGDTAGSSLITATIPSLAPGASGTLTFKRTVK